MSRDDGMTGGQFVLNMDSVKMRGLNSHAPGDEAARLKALTTYHAMNRLNDTYTYILSAAIGFVLLVGTLRNVWLRWHYKRLRWSKYNDNIRPSSMSRLSTNIREKVTLPALNGEDHIRHPQFYRNPYAIPSRLNAILLVSFTLLNIFFCCFGFVTYDGNIFFPGPKYYQFLRYFANRIGSMFFANTPLLIALAGRNNILIWLTGWSFDTFQVYHRWIARIVLAQATAHVITYSLYCALPGNDDRPGVYFRQWVRNYWIFGVLAYFLLWSLCVHSLRIFRRHYYEFFLLSHIVMVIIYFIGLFTHVFHRLKVEWLWISVSFWAFDRSLRFLKIIWINIPWKHPSRGFSVAEVQCLSGEVMRIKVRVAQPWNYWPGQSVYVYFPTLLFGFWQSHPISILACTKEFGEKNMEDVPSVEGGREIDITEEDDKLFDIPLLQTDSSSESKVTYFHFLTKAQTGLTRRIRKTALLRDSYKLTAFIEGPYGISDTFDMYPSVLFISGGVAVTFTMSHLVRLLETKSRDPTTRVQKVHHVWVIREQDNLEWIQQELHRIAQLDLPKDFLKMSFYVSQMENGVSEVPNIGIENSQIFPHRPDIPEIISNAAQERLGTLAVVGLSHQFARLIEVCGPGEMADQARKSVVENLKRTNGDIEYFEEAFGW